MRHRAYIFGSVQLFLFLLKDFIIILVPLKLLLATVKQQLAEVDTSSLLLRAYFQLEEEKKSILFCLCSLSPAEYE